MLQDIPKTCDMTKNKASVGPAIKIIAKLQICLFPKSSHLSKTYESFYIWGIVCLFSWLYAFTRDVQVADF